MKDRSIPEYGVSPGETNTIGPTNKPEVEAAAVRCPFCGQRDSTVGDSERGYKCTECEGLYNPAPQQATAPAEKEGKLSDRIRPNSECAPWVVEAVKKMEAEHLAEVEKLKKDIGEWASETKTAKLEIERLRQALRKIATGFDPDPKQYQMCVTQMEEVAQAALEESGG